MSRIGVTIDGQFFEIELSLLQRGDEPLTMIVNGEVLQVSASSLDNLNELEWVLVDNRPYEIVVDRDLRWIKAYSGLHQLEVRDLDAAVTRPVSSDGRVKAPIPGLITRVRVAEGDQVEAGQRLMVLEAMKMENEIIAPRSGFVRTLNVQAGQSVMLGEVLIDIT